MSDSFDEETEILRNGVPVVEIHLASTGRTVSAERWRELFASAPSVDAEFARDVEVARQDLGPPSDS